MTEQHLGIASPACATENVRHLEYFHDHARQDRVLFDGVLDPCGGVLRPDLDRPGLGLRLAVDRAAPYRVADTRPAPASSRVLG
jgi:hypothetical protein